MKLKLTYPQLALMDWLMEKPGLRFSTRGGMRGSNDYMLYELGEAREDGKRPVECVLSPYDRSETAVAITRRIGGRCDLSKLHQFGLLGSLGILNCREERLRFMERLDRDPFHYAEILMPPTRVAREWWKSEGEAQFRRESERREAEARKVGRLVLIGRGAEIVPRVTESVRKARNLGVRLPDLTQRLVRPYAVATVTRETDARLYVENVVVISAADGFEYSSPVQGREPNRFVERGSVMADGIAMTDALSVVELDAEYRDDLVRILDQTMERVAPILVEAASRLAQKNAERSDLFRERIESALARNGGDRAPSAHDEEGPESDPRP